MDDYQGWIYLAEVDLDGIYKLSSGYSPSIRLTCYHCQQCVEKSSLPIPKG